jgi:hypothetical protein
MEIFKERNDVIFEQAVGIDFQVVINETKNGIARNSTATFEVLAGNITISDVSLTAGAFAANVWTIGDMNNEANTGNFQIIPGDNVTSYAQIRITVSTTTVGENTSNNVITYTWRGLSKTAYDLNFKSQYIETVEDSGTFTFVGGGSVSETIPLNSAIKKGSSLKYFAFTVDTELVTAGSPFTIQVRASDSVSGVISSGFFYALGNGPFPVNTKFSQVIQGLQPYSGSDIFQIDEIRLNCIGGSSFTSGAITWTAVFDVPIDLPNTP